MEQANDNRCDECEKFRKNIYICLNCIELICSDCDLKVHNKGTRVRHVRVPHRVIFYEDKNSKDFKITYFSSQCYKNNLFNRKSPEDEIRKLIFEKLLENTKKGIPMMLAENLTSYLKEYLHIDEEVILKHLNKELKGSLFHQTIRTFGDYDPKKYFSLCLSNVSIEAIQWVIKSIKNDAMQPTETLIHSRFKECFAIKISMKEWKNFVEKLEKNERMKKKLNQYKSFLSEIEVTKDVESGNVLFKLKDEGWVYEDLGEVKDTDLDYQTFLEFVENFFSETQTPKVEKNKEKPKDIKKWLSSVENSHVKNSSYLCDQNMKKILQNKSIKKAIPGGKYGCALMMKNCGPEILRKLTLGRINALIKHALNSQILIHYKTLIIKNEKNVNTSSSERENQIFEIQRNIIELLKENESSGVTLAQLPLLLTKKYEKIYNFPELGFPKLKSFLMTMEDYVELERSHNNHIKVKLKKKTQLTRKKHSDSNLNHSRQNNEYRSQTKLSEYSDQQFYNIYDHKSGFKTLKPNPFDEKYKQIEMGIRSTYEHKKSCSNLQQYLDNVRDHVFKALKKNQFGIQVNKLEKLLSNSLGTEFDPKIFKAEDFKDFLLMNFDEYIDIELKRSIGKKSQNQNSSKKSMIYMVYPKNYNKINNMNTLSRVFNRSSHRDFNVYNSYFEPDMSDLRSNQSNPQFNVIKHTNDSFSDTSLLAYQNNYNSTLSFSNQHTLKNDRKKPDDKVITGFEFQVISPIPSLSTTQLLYEETKDNNEPTGDDDTSNPDMENKSLKFVQYLLDDE